MKTYLEKLKDPRWQKKRLQILKRDEFRCQICWNDKKTLHIHHKRYEKNKNPWQYELIMLITLCQDCHEKIHPKRKEIIKIDEPEFIPLTEEEIEIDKSEIEKSRSSFFNKYRNL